MPTSEWHVLGAGAIGSLFAASLGRAGTNCTLLLREAPRDERELHIEEGGETNAVRLPCSNVQDRGAIVRLLVTTKAHQAVDALRGIRHRLEGVSDILLMTNGMGLAEAVGPQFPNARVYCATTTEGAYRRSPNHIVHAGRGTTLIGSPSGAAMPDWFGPWQKLDLECQWSTDIQSAMWLKLAINCAINPLTALHRCRNGELLSNPDLRSAMAGLCEEIARVSQALGYHAAASELYATVERVAAATANNRSSMLQDVCAGQATEIDYITGYLVRRAEAAGVEVPRNRAILEAVKHG